MHFMMPLPSFLIFSFINHQLSLVPEGLISGLHNRLLPQLYCLEALPLTTLPCNISQQKNYADYYDLFHK